MPTQEYCRMITAGIVDEIQAQIQYADLIKATNSGEDKKLLMKIKKQEYEHMLTLQGLLEDCFSED